MDDVPRLCAIGSVLFALWGLAVFADNLFSHEEEEQMSSPIDRLDEVVRELKAAGFNIGVAVYRPPTPSSAGMVYNNLAMRGPYTHKAWLAGQALNDVLAALIDAHHRPNDVPLTSTRL